MSQSMSEFELCSPIPLFRYITVTIRTHTIRVEQTKSKEDKEIGSQESEYGKEVF